MARNPIISNAKVAAGTNRDDLDFVFSTTHPFGKEQANVPYHADGARV